MFRDKSVPLLSHIDYSSPITSYVKVQGSTSPFSPIEAIYWAKRNANYPGFNIRTRKLLKKQKGYCNICGLPFWYGEVMEVDHIVPLSRGGKNQYANLQLLHRHCHDVKTAQDLKS